MSLVRPATAAEAGAAMAAEADPVLISGGTDLMVAINGRRRSATTFVSLRHAADLHGIAESGGVVRIGGMTTYATLLAGGPVLAGLPMLCDLAGRLGNPSQRNAGTLGGGVGSARWNGDAIAALAALDAKLDVVSSTTEREVGIEAWLARTNRAPDDVVRSMLVKVPAGPQIWLRAAERATAVEASATLALVIDVAQRTVRCVVGSVARTPIRATGAEALLTDSLDWESPGPAPELCRAFGAAVRADVTARSTYRVSESHRRHLAGVLAFRALSRAFAA